MSFQNELNIISRIDFLVRTRRTGSAQELSLHLGISQRKLYRVISDMRDLGAPISWSRESYSYIYKRPGKLEMKFMEAEWSKN